jgi:hypothetical protein
LGCVKGGDLASFSDKEEEESWHWRADIMFYSSVLWIGFRQYDGEGTEGQVDSFVLSIPKKEETTIQ